jgi:hypothetical protein
VPRDTQIFSGADHAGNSDYTLPGNSEIEVLAVNANFKDNGAGADWCPAVVMFSDSGHVIARAMLPEVKVTAGGDAEVSFFPGVKPAAASSGTTGLKWCKVVCGVSVPPTDPLTIASFATNDPTNYVQVDATSWQIPAFPQVLVGYSNPFGPVTTAGSIVAGVQNGSGYTIYGSAGTGVDVQLLPFDDLLHTAFEVQNDWHAYANGTDTHFWAVHASYFYVG